MSECVVRIMIPVSCYSCELRTRCILYRMWLADEITMPKPLDDGCRIICSLPEGHGRLIDAEALKDYLVAEAASYDLTQGQMGILSEAIDMIDEQPTIVPADTAERREA